MKNTVILAACLLLSSAWAGAAVTDRPGKLGLGVELGEQNGVTAKYWLDARQALDAGLGESDGDFSFHAGYLIHAFDLLPKPPQGALEAHAGLGIRERYDQFGLRAVGGAGYWVENHPVELFLDAGPIFRMTPDAGVDFTAALGVRFYFKPGR